MESPGGRKHFILVHGACHGAWSWYKLSTLLRSAGHRVTAVDLAASGVDPGKLQDVRSFADYSRPLLEAIGALPDEERVILVGHSLGGISIALAMEKFSHKISVAVFVTAFMPSTTHSPAYVLEEYSRRTPKQAWMDTQLEFGNGLDKPPTSLLFGPQIMSSKIYQLCPPEDHTLAMTLLRKAPFCLEDLSNILSLSKSKYGSVNKVYIVCGEDLIISVEFQRWMIENNPVKEVRVIESVDHMPSLSKPKELFESLMSIVDTYT